MGTHGAAGRPLSVLHLVGSPVDEFFADLSRLYAGGALAALATDGTYEHHVAYVAPGGAWSFPADLGAQALAAAVPMAPGDAMAHVARLGIDVVVPQMFCRPGMTAYRALFEVLGIPVVGNPPEVMAIAADKAAARAIVSAAGVAVPAGEVVRTPGPPPLPLPVVVKPVDGDNSMGVTLVREAWQYGPAVTHALANGSAALVETYVPLGREVRCGIIVRDGELVCLPLEEYSVDPDTKPIRTRDDKLDRSGDGDLFLVAKDARRAWLVPEDDPVTAAVWAAARRCHEALGCRHYSLFDFRIDPDGLPWFLEAGPYCSYAPSSVVAMMAAAKGIDVSELFAIALRELNLEEARCSITTP